MNIGFAEGLVIALIAVLLIKPEELRVAARTAGRWMREMRKMSNEFMSELSREADLSDLREETKKLEREIGSMDISEVDEQMENYLQGDVEDASTERDATEDVAPLYEAAEDDAVEDEAVEHEPFDHAAAEHMAVEQDATDHGEADAGAEGAQSPAVGSQGE